MTTRVFHIHDQARPNSEAVCRTVICQSEQANIIGWCMLPGQEIAPHRHPQGQDTWTVVSGEADYLLGNGEIRRLRTGDIAVAAPGQVHGARAAGAEPFVFVSVVAPAAAGFEPADG